MQLDALRIFAKVAEQASFTRAAEQLGLPKARVSTTVQQLETELGTRLLQRTTRTVRITPDGELLLERAQALLADADELQALFQRSPSTLRGRVRVDMPQLVARHVVIPRLPEFIAAHPLLEIDLSSTDRRVDPVHEGFDCVLRVGTLHDSGLVARPLGRMRQINCVSPAYVQRHGKPQSLDELAEHFVVHYAPTPGGGGPPGFELHDEQGTRVQPMRVALTVNNTEAYRAACLAGLGLIQAPALGLRRHVAQGRLVEVLPALAAAPLPVSLLYPHRRQLPQRAQALMNWLAAVLADYLDGSSALTAPR